VSARAFISSAIGGTNKRAAMRRALRPALGVREAGREKGMSHCLARLFVALVLTVACATQGCATQGRAEPGSADPAEIERTWKQAWVFVPAADGPEQIGMADLERLMTGRSGIPVAIYLHGCAGLWLDDNRRGLYLAGLGVLVIAPDSFARRDKPKSCEPRDRKGGLHRGTLALRHAEAAYAIARARALPWVDPDQMVLVGHSEGGIATATLAARHTRGLKARIIEGWGCHAAWPEYAGLNNPPDQPVLSLVGNRDPWFRHAALRGDCGEFMNNPESLSIVYRDPPLSHEHGLLDHAEPRSDLRAFLCARIVCTGVAHN